jgi:hypothetical protein
MLRAEAMHPNGAYPWREQLLNTKLQINLSACLGSVSAVSAVPAACKGQQLLVNECGARPGGC